MAAYELLTAVLVQELTDFTDLEHIQTNLTAASLCINDVAGASVLFSNSDHGDPVRVLGYVDEVVSMYSDIAFRSHFRMERTTFEDLCTEVGPNMERVRSMTVQKRLLATLWMLGNTESYRSVADRFGISKGTLHLTVVNTCKVLSSLTTSYIKFPTTSAQLRTIAQGFEDHTGFPGVVGAIDGTHIPIPGPVSEFRASYINRKGFSTGMQLQVVCDSNLKFLDTYTGWP